MNHLPFHKVIEFWLSSNNVVLTRGVKDKLGNDYVPTAFIRDIHYLVTGKTLWRRGHYTQDGNDLFGFPIEVL